MALEFAPLMGEVARHLLGDPNPALSSETEWRYGTRGSLSVDLEKGSFYDHELGMGGGVLDLVSRETQLNGPERLDWLKAKGLVYETHEGHRDKPKLIATYDYCDESGKLLMQVVRFEPKDFRQRRPPSPGDSSDMIKGGWVWSVKGVRRTPYRLPDLLEADERVLFIVEGEKDCDRLWDLGVPATCNPGGANKWHTDLTKYFIGADVVIVPDRDQAGQEHAAKVAGTLAGAAKRVRVLELWQDWPEMPLKGDVVDWLARGGTVERLYALAGKCADFSCARETEKSAYPVPLRSAFPIDEKTIPLRDWIIPGLLLRRNLSVLVAPPASGKSLLTLQLAIAIALGIAWGGWFPRAPEKVLVINAEDDFDEMCRRLCAAARDMGVDQAALVDRIYLADAPETIVIAKMDHRTKSVIRTPLGDQLVATIQQAGIGVAIADPFAETFEGDENSNSEVKWAGILWREVARKTGAALWLVHHTRKYAGSMAGEQDASRGGGALIGTARIMSTLFNMTEDEAKLLDVLEDDRTDYVRFDDAKSNHSAKGVVKWFRKRTVILDNGNERFGGDEVGVLAPWKPPGLMDSVHMGDITQVLDAIARGVVDDDGAPTGQLYSPATNSDRYVGDQIAAMLGASDEKAKGMVKAWLESGVLLVVEYDDPKQRKPRKGIRVVAGKRPDMAQNFG